MIRKIQRLSIVYIILFMRVALDFDILVVGRVILMRKKKMRTFDLDQQINF